MNKKEQLLNIAALFCLYLLFVGVLSVGISALIYLVK